MKVHLRTFGCRANHYDTEQVRALVAAMGASESDAADADIAVLNSCAVTSDAEADLRDDLPAWLAQAFPVTDTVVYEGGQPLWPMIMGVE